MLPNESNQQGLSVIVSGTVETPTLITSSFCLKVISFMFSRGNKDCRAGREGQDSVLDNEGGDDGIPLDIGGLFGGVWCFLLWKPGSAVCCGAVCWHVAICSVSFSMSVIIF